MYLHGNARRRVFAQVTHLQCPLERAMRWSLDGRNLFNRCHAVEGTNERDSNLYDFSVKAFIARGKPESR